MDVPANHFFECTRGPIWRIGMMGQHFDSNCPSVLRSMLLLWFDPFVGSWRRCFLENVKKQWPSHFRPIKRSSPSSALFHQESAPKVLWIANKHRVFKCVFGRYSAIAPPIAYTAFSSAVFHLGYCALNLLRWPWSQLSQAPSSGGLQWRCHGFSRSFLAWWAQLVIWSVLPLWLMSGHFEINESKMKWSLTLVQSPCELRPTRLWYT